MQKKVFLNKILDVFLFYIKSCSPTKIKHSRLRYLVLNFSSVLLFFPRIDVVRPNQFSFWVIQYPIPRHSFLWLSIFNCTRQRDVLHLTSMIGWHTFAACVFVCYIRAVALSVVLFYFVGLRFFYMKPLRL